MRILSKAIRSFIFGVGVGTLIECILSILFKDIVVGTPDFVAAHSSVVFVKIVQTIIYGGFGVVSVLASSLIYNRGYSLFKETTIHIIVLIIYFGFAGFYLRWFANIGGFLWSLITFFIIYIIIWTVIYFSEKKKIENINKKINEMKS